VLVDGWRVGRLGRKEMVYFANLLSSLCCRHLYFGCGTIGESVISAAGGGFLDIWRHCTDRHGFYGL
jgi:hypothetical protein